MKIRIIGAPGSGKSTLARQLANKYSIAHYDLDNIQWDNTAASYGVKTPPEKREKLLNEILEKEDWIIEGVYYAWCQRTFEEADKIILVEVSKTTCKLRTIKRFIKRKLGLEKGKKETLKSLCALLKWIDKFYAVNLKEIKAILKEYPQKTLEP